MAGFNPSHTPILDHDEACEIIDDISWHELSSLSL